MTKFQGLLSACSLEVIQSRFLRKLTTPSLLVTPLTHPSSSTSICRILATISLSQRSMREKQLLINLLSLLTPMQSSQVSPQVPEPVCKEGFARCQELWQSQCHNRISTLGTRCTTWRHKPCVSMNEHLHNYHINLQECMCHPIVFLLEMMGGIMYLHQALCQGICGSCHQGS
jgi:hypothetical protein